MIFPGTRDLIRTGTKLYGRAGDVPDPNLRCWACGDGPGPSGKLNECEHNIGVQAGTIRVCRFEDPRPKIQ